MKLKIEAALLLVLGCLYPVSAQTITVGTDTTTARPVPDGLFGYNDECSQTVNRMDPNLLAVEARISSQVIRTNGEDGNYTDWKAGLFLTNYTPYKPNARNGYPRTLATLGLPVKYVELGTEFYFTGMEGYQPVVPTGHEQMKLYDSSKQLTPVINVIIYDS